MEFLACGGAKIQKMIDNAVLDGTRTATVTGSYEIEQTILLPSDFTLILSNCHLRMAPDTFCNLLTNVSCRVPGGADHDIRIRGEGKAILDGGEYNGLSERNCGRDGRPHISVNNLLLFANVTHFRVEGIQVCNQRWWALDFIHCAYGYIGSIDVRSDYSRIDENGQRVWGLTRDTYEQVYIKNSDGIDIRTGCHDILIENITGFTEDDTVAITGLDGVLENMFLPEGQEKEIYNITVRNVNAAAYCAVVRLLNQGGVKLYNILVDGVMDASRGSPYLDRGGNTVRVGDTHMYGPRHPTEEETFNITVRNVCSRAGAALRVAGRMKDCLFENIRVFDGGDEVIANDTDMDISAFVRN